MARGENELQERNRNFGQFQHGDGWGAVYQNRDLPAHDIEEDGEALVRAVNKLQRYTSLNCFLLSSQTG